MYLGCSFAEFSTPLEVGVMDSEVILQPKQMGHSLVVFFFLSCLHFCPEKFRENVMDRQLKNT